MFILSIYVYHLIFLKDVYDLTQNLLFISLSQNRKQMIITKTSAFMKDIRIEILFICSFNSVVWPESRWLALENDAG